MKYEKAVARIIELDNSDVITISRSWCLGEMGISPCHGPNFSKYEDGLCIYLEPSMMDPVEPEDPFA